MNFVESSSALYAVGICTIVYVLCTSVYNLYTYFVIYFGNVVLDYRRFGPWALVTGATDGIGKGIARQLAKMGINIVLVSRNPEKLSRVAKEMESEFQVETRCIALDFTKSDDVTDHLSPSVYDVISNGIRDLEIGILVNNVGMGSTKPAVFHECFCSKNDRKKLSEGILNLVNCNVASQVKVTQLVLPGMIKRGKGLVINISSCAAKYVFPFGAIYAGSKRFNDHFSRALSYEYENKGIMVQSIQPGFVYTNLAASTVNLSKNFTCPDYNTYAAHAMRTVGKEKMTHGYWWHAFQMWIAGLNPERFIVFGHNMMMKINSGCNAQWTDGAQVQADEKNS